MFLLAFLAFLANYSSVVSGHGYLAGTVVNGKYYPGFNNTLFKSSSNPSHVKSANRPKTIAWSVNNTELLPIYPWQYNTTRVVCGISAYPGALHATATAGKQLTFEWAPRAWYSSHVGPVSTSMARCPGSCSDLTPEQKQDLKFFKIDEAGWNVEGSGSVTKGLWAVDIMMRQNMTWTVTLPPTIKAGNYIARFEILALQVAAYGGAEVYPACINLEVRSDGMEDPEGIKMTEFYRDLEAPGLNLNLYMPFTEYKIPGPPLWKGAIRTQQAYPNSSVIPHSQAVESLTFIPDSNSLS